MSSTENNNHPITVITGGGGALCGAIAEGLARNGSYIVLLDIDEKAMHARVESIETSGGRASYYICDITNEKSVIDIEKTITNEIGPPDHLINGAGGNDKRATTDSEFLEVSDIESTSTQTLFDIDIDNFKRVFEINYHGTFIPSQVFSKGMARRGGGSIVNISSMAAFTPLTKVVAYSSAKAAVVNLTKWLSVHLSKVGIRVNSIAPGFFMTEQLRFMHVDQETGQYTPRAQKVVDHTPMQRYGNPDELLGAVKWLLSDEAGFVTGAVIPIDGGFSSFAI